MKTLLVGIGGPSCGGKSTLSNWLNSLLGNSYIIHQDVFYKTNIPKTQSGIEHWDCPDAIDNEAFLSNLKKSRMENGNVLSKNRPKMCASDISDEARESLQTKLKTINDCGFKIILVDGFLIYCSSELMQQFDLKLFVKASYDTLLNRRNKRSSYTTYTGHWEDPPGYFDTIVWPSYLQYNNHILQQDETGIDFTVLDTDKLSIEEMVVRAIDSISARVSDHHIKQY